MIKQQNNIIKVTNLQTNNLVQQEVVENVITQMNVVAKEIVSLENGFISASFSSGDNIVVIGDLPTGVRILNTIVDVTNALGGTLTVGNDNYNAILQTVNDNDLNNVNSYITFNNYLNPIGQSYKGYFNNNLSSGTITIYYH
jgi:c-di-AMP phosphodiesterase-like protein